MSTSAVAVLTARREEKPVIGFALRRPVTTPEEWQADSGLAERNPALDGDSRSD